MTTTCTFALGTPTQFALWNVEIVGQLSDGLWENAYPRDHWKAWCNAKTIIDPDHIGRNFYAERDTYSLTNLVYHVEERMRYYGALATMFPEETVALLNSGDYSLPDNYDQAFRYYNNDRDEAYVKRAVTAWNAAGFTMEKFVAAYNNIDCYTHKQLCKDLSAIKKAMKNRTDI